MLPTMNQEYGSRYEPIPCTSVPYWDERCGVIFYKQEEFEPKFDSRLGEMENVVLTPHAGSASVRARTGMVELAAKNIETFFLTNEVLNPVNTLN